MSCYLAFRAETGFFSYGRNNRGILPCNTWSKYGPSGYVDLRLSLQFGVNPESALYLALQHQEIGSGMPRCRRITDGKRASIPRTHRSAFLLDGMAGGFLLLEGSRPLSR